MTIDNISKKYENQLPTSSSESAFGTESSSSQSSERTRYLKKCANHAHNLITMSKARDMTQTFHLISAQKFPGYKIPTGYQVIKTSATLNAYEQAVRSELTKV